MSLQFSTRSRAMLSSLLCAILCCIPVPAAHALRGIDKFFSRASYNGAAHLRGLQASDKLAASEMIQVEPVEMSHAMVTTAVPPDLQRALLHDPWAAHGGAASVQGTAQAGSESRRALLHGSRKAWKYASCNRCTFVSCNPSRTSCTSHCKKNSKLFFCRRNNIPGGVCISPPPGTPPPTTPDALRTYQTVIVTAPAPYIGCADIANRPSGCPATFTAGKTADGAAITVARSKCLSEGYTPDCGSPFYPFGLCECTMFISGMGIVTKPCNSSELALGVRAGPPGGPSTNEEGVEVDVRGATTFTGFSDYTAADDEAEYTYNVTVTTAGANVTVVMDYFATDVMLATNFTEEADISPDYDYGEFSTY